MAELSLNQLQLRLSDDEGWRIEIKELEELTEYASKRCFDPTRTKCIMPQMGSGPETDSSEGGSGFLTQNEYKQILEKAEKLNIRIVPEIVAPGHSGAAIHAMKLRNQTEYLLTDPDQDSDDSTSVQGYYDNTINPCIESSFNFLSTVVGEIANMHKEYMNHHNYFHLGYESYRMTHTV